MDKGQRFNRISHLAGAVLALCGATVLIVMASLTIGNGIANGMLQKITIIKLDIPMHTGHYML